MMADTFDPYREALVMETKTIWPSELDILETFEKARLDKLLHAEPSKAANITYVRTHSGFCREITVTQNDIQRVKGSVA